MGIEALGSSQGQDSRTRSEEGCQEGGGLIPKERLRSVEPKQPGTKTAAIVVGLEKSLTFSLTTGSGDFWAIHLVT